MLEDLKHSILNHYVTGFAKISFNTSFFLSVMSWLPLVMVILRIIMLDKILYSRKINTTILQDEVFVTFTPLRQQNINLP